MFFPFTWKNIVLAAVGIYSNIKTSSSQHLLLTAINGGYVNMYDVWNARLNELGMKHLLVKFGRFETKSQYQIQYNVNVTEKPTKFRQRDFNIISHLKIEIVFKLMVTFPEIKYFWFSDCDIYFIKDPYPIFSFSGDYEFMQNSLHGNWKPFNESNTGFYIIKNNINTKKLLENVLIYSKKFSHIDDQTNFWNYLKNTSSNLKFLPMHHTLISNGRQTLDCKKQYVYHCNFITGMSNKLHRFLSIQKKCKYKKRL